MNEEYTVVAEMSDRPPLPTTYGGWLCHRCEKEVYKKRDTPNHEWHICDKCTR